MLIIIFDTISVLRRVKDLQDLVNKHQEQVDQGNVRVDDIRDKLRELRNYRHSIDNSQAAKVINIRDRTLMIDIQVCPRVEKFGF